MKTIKDVLTHALTTIKEGYGNFICLEIAYSPANPDLNNRTLQHFKENKPTKTLHKQFYKNKYFKKQSLMNTAWWTVPTSYRNLFYNNTKLNKHYEKEKLKISQEKIKFLQYLIDRL